MTERFQGQTWQRFDHWIKETRPFVYRVQNPASKTIGWITVKGAHYLARSGYGMSVATSEILGTFSSAQAALRLVIGHDAMEALRDQVRKEVLELEKAESVRSPRSARDRFL